MQAAAVGLRTTGLGRCPGDSADPAQLRAASCVRRELRSAGLVTGILRDGLVLVHSRLWSLRPSLGAGLRLAPLRPWRTRPPHRPSESASCSPGWSPHREPGSHGERGVYWRRPTRPCPGPLPSARAPPAAQWLVRHGAGASGLWRRVGGHGVRGTCCTERLVPLCRCPALNSGSDQRAESQAECGRLRSGREALESSCSATS